ncbi:hypothetical protein [Pedobacter sp. L105]|uniref:hypothetical protein n=1 Tax=Pedobacter sp. L105 TaxID=1641871 RepID=UPI00131CEA10|nr:hypothetical protein [Pedobacter sp. L105]
MIITVLSIIDTQRTGLSLSKMMNQRLERLAQELQNVHLKPLRAAYPGCSDLVVYISYTSSYTIKWRVVNDVPREIEQEVAKYCGKLGYIEWKTDTVNIFKKF